VWGAAALLVLGALFFNQALFGLGLVLSAALFVAWGWARWCLSNLTIQRRFSHTRAFWGEEVTMDHVFVNNKPLPLPWLVVEDQFPSTLKLLPPAQAHKALPGKMSFTTVFSLGWYERLTRHYRLLCQARGEHDFGPIDIRSGDEASSTSTIGSPRTSARSASAISIAPAACSSSPAVAVRLRNTRVQPSFQSA
jgi:uncharacterized protein (DUF58 family)